MRKESEKNIERKLRERVKKKGGWCIKLLPGIINGLPDRICLMPGGHVFFVETKSTGDKPRPIQLNVHSRLRKLGFPVYIVDTSAKIELLFKLEEE